MRRILIVAIFATVALPVYGQKKSPKPTTVQNVPQQQNKPIPQLSNAPVGPVNEQASNKQENRTEQHPENYLKRVFAPENLPNIGLFFAGMAGIWVELRTNYKMTLKTVEVWIDREMVRAIAFRNPLLVRDDYIPAEVEYRLTGQKLVTYRQGILKFEIGGVVSYTDAFKDTQRQNFGFHCSCRNGAKGEFEPVAFEPPDAREIEAQQRRKAQTQAKKPN